ncbi:MAG: glycosyltransferase [Planctomycetes bacterium]|nr:glycosyltransferase [Planctomycetota bacterium]
MIQGGAQENTLATCLLQRDLGYCVRLVSGPLLGQGDEMDSLVRDIVRERLSYKVIPELVREISPWKDALALRALIAEFARTKPDVVHTHSAKAGVIGRLAARICGVPAIHTHHGCSFHPYQPAGKILLYAGIERAMFSLTDYHLFVAEAERTKLLGLGIDDPGKTKVVRSGFDVEIFRRWGENRSLAREELGFDERDVVITNVGRLVPLKGQEDLLKACKSIFSKYCEAKLVFIGEGMLRGELESRARDNFPRDSVVFRGHVEPSEIARHFAASDVLVHTSYREGLARVIPQALISGAPVIAYDEGGASEVIDDDVDGKLIEKGNLKALENAIESFVEGRTGWRVSNKKRWRLVHDFNRITMVNSILEAYRTVLHKRSKTLTPEPVGEDNETGDC